MSDINNPHDKLFKETLSVPDNAKDFLQDYLPKKILEQINIQTLEICKDSFIEESLSEFFSDILYSVSFSGQKGYIYLLLEHKSSYDKYTPIQLLQYMLQIWKQHIKENKTSKLPIIVPLVLYHGKSKWNIGTNFINLFDDPPDDLKPYIPDFEYILYDLSQYTDEHIKQRAVYYACVLLAFKYVFGPEQKFLEKIREGLELISSIIDQETGIKALIPLFKYVFNVVGNNCDIEDIKKIITPVSDKKEELIMTLAESLINQGMERGIERGMERGMKKGELNMLSSLYNKGVLTKKAFEKEAAAVQRRKED